MRPRELSPHSAGFNVLTFPRFTPSPPRTLLSLLAILLPVQLPAGGNLVYETTSPYHHIRVVDDGGLRTLFFDNAPQSIMSLSDKATGHFEYTEYFHMPWLWNTQLCDVLMIGLGGGSTQRSFEHYYPDVSVRTVELDPAVARVAGDYFNVRESEKQKVELSDGRVFLRRSRAKYDVIILDAYISGRYGSSIPQHLATKEFFELARDHLATNGIIAYNVIGTLTGWHSDIVGAMYRTLGVVFPQVYIFPAKTSLNVVLIATRSPVGANLDGLRWRAAQMVQTRRVSIPGFRQRVEAFHPGPPASAARSPILTDDYAPVEGLSGVYANPDRAR
jgi:spermidine synthase